jgi:hypothetical protein
MNYSEINIRVGLNEDKIPSDIKWKATDSEVNQMTDAKAFGLNIWDPSSISILKFNPMDRRYANA